MRRAIQPVVEGDGDLRAVPVLIRRLLSSKELDNIHVLPPQRRGELPKVRAEFSRFLRVAQKENAPILWVMDFDCTDCTCAKREYEQLMARARIEIGDWPVEFCFMVKEFETLFLADEKTTREYFSIPPTEVWPVEAEQIRDAKGTISRLLPKGQTYKPTLHQDKLAARVSLEMGLNQCRSLDHLRKALDRLVQRMPE